MRGRRLAVAEPNPRPLIARMLTKRLDAYSAVGLMRVIETSDRLVQACQRSAASARVRLAVRRPQLTDREQWRAESALALLTHRMRVEEERLDLARALLARIDPNACNGE